MSKPTRTFVSLRRLASVTVLLLLAALNLSAFSGCDKGTKTVVKKPVRLGYFANLTHAQAVLGVSSGDFQKAIGDAKLEPAVFNAGPALIEALLADQIDIGYVGPGPALNAFARTKGQGVRVISGSAANGVLIVARKESGITKLTDVAGKHVATPQRGNTQDISARHYLLSELKQKDAENVLPVNNAEQAAMMARGQIDASWAPEPWGSLLIAQAGATLVGEEKDLWPDKQFASVVIITTPKFVQEHGDVVKQFLAVHQEWTNKLSSDPQKYVPDLSAALFKLTNKELPADVIKSAVGYTRFSTDPLPATFDTYAKWSFALGFAKEQANLTGLIDASLLPTPAVATPK